MNNNHARSNWSQAYRMARAMAWGSLWCSFGRPLAERAIEARDFTRIDPVLTARRFKSLGYYAKGLRRI
jgi:hypothetical protein